MVGGVDECGGQVVPAEPVAGDELEAVAGDVLAGRWEVRRRLGTGSTSRAFLVRDLSVAAAGQSSSAGSRKSRELAVARRPHARALA
ncbi:MAG TPA: hypothetical protein VGX23_31530 [Actinocrinis sp.]|nr:hypothetical protein [Actinocrinis sp.]